MILILLGFADLAAATAAAVASTARVFSSFSFTLSVQYFVFVSSHLCLLFLLFFHINSILSHRSITLFFVVHETSFC